MNEFRWNFAFKHFSTHNSNSYIFFIRKTTCARFCFLLSPYNLMRCFYFIYLSIRITFNNVRKCQNHAGQMSAFNDPQFKRSIHSFNSIRVMNFLLNRKMNEFSAQIKHILRIIEFRKKGIIFCFYFLKNILLLSLIIIILLDFCFEDIKH